MFSGAPPPLGQAASSWSAGLTTGGLLGPALGGLSSQIGSSFGQAADSLWGAPAPPALSPVQQPGQTRPANAGLQALGQEQQPAFQPLVPLQAQDDTPNVAYHTTRSANIADGNQPAPPLANMDEGDLVSGWEEFGNAHLDALFADAGLDGATSAACGPIAVAGLLRAFGVDENPASIAERGLDNRQWSPGLGMTRGDGSAVSDLLGSYGIKNINLPSKASTIQAITSLVQRGVPVILNGPNHYLLAQDYDSQTGKFFVGATGSNALDGGADWMTLQDMANHPGVGGAIESFIVPTQQPRSTLDARSKQRFSPQSTDGDANPTPQDVAKYIVQSAAQRRIQPQAALRVAQGEGGLEAARRGTFDTGSSWWPFQLHYGGPGYEQYGNTVGMGTAFTQETGWQPGDPRAWKASIDYALDQARKAGSWGAWYGRQNTGVGLNEGFL